MIATLVAEILDIGSSRIPAVDIIEKAARLEEEVDRQLEDAAWLGDQANKVQLCK
jgi:NaMN:DMB phosphoribosyltransferase